MNRRRILSFLLCLLTAAGITLSGTASAHAEYTITSYACIRADYEDSITPSQGDRFELSYKLIDFLLRLGYLLLECLFLLLEFHLYLSFKGCVVDVVAF